MRGAPFPSHAYNGNRPDGVLHARRAHPDWEYATTEGPRKHWDDVNQPPLDDNGDPDPTWERNLDAGRPGEGWERFNYTEESYWRRRKTHTEEATATAEEIPLEAAQASLDLRDAVIDLLQARAEHANTAADQACRFAITFQTRIDDARDWGRRNLDTDQQEQLLRVLRGDSSVPGQTDPAPAEEPQSELRVGDKATCRHCDLEIIWEPWFWDGRGPNPPVWSHTASGVQSCSIRPKGGSKRRWPMAEPTDSPAA
ncbi:hypothetical protein [Streptomyces sp. NPDC047972]|uniref:hypothetical protein n=1 Tax=Streptomyces sp. NPDC047972 TaxID=3365493 RepID=UPI003722111F